MNDDVRAAPFATTALDLARADGDPVLLADCLDATLAADWGPDDLDRRRGWAQELDDVVAHLRDSQARLQAYLWSLTVAWELLDLPRIHRNLRSVTGLGGRSRDSGSSTERARVAVRKAIVAALGKVAGVQPELGRHLYERVSTGTTCRYEPDPSVTWLL